MSEVKNEGFFGESSWDDYRKKAIRFSAACIGALTTLAILMHAVYEMSDSVFNTKRNWFSAIEPCGLNISDYEHNMEIDGIIIDIIDVRHSANSVKITVSGRNNRETDWRSVGSVFVLSSFNVKSAEPRHHYYSDEISDIVIKANEAYFHVLNFDVPNAELKAKSGYVFSLTAFKDDPMQNLEILVDVSKTE